MSLSTDVLEKSKLFSSKNNGFILNPESDDISIEETKKNLCSENIVDNQENIEDFNDKINKNLQILNFIFSGNEKQTSTKSCLIENIHHYNLNMIDKYDENLKTNLSFISDFDLEEKSKSSLNDSFNSMDSKINCEEQIEIISSSRQILLFDDEEIDIQLKNEWNDIKKILLDKELSQ